MHALRQDGENTDSRKSRKDAHVSSSTTLTDRIESENPFPSSLDLQRHLHLHPAEEFRPGITDPRSLKHVSDGHWNLQAHWDLMNDLCSKSL